MYKFKHEKWMKVVLIVAGVVAVLSQFLNLYHIANVILWIHVFGLFSVVVSICGLIIGCFTLLLAVRPNNPIPLNWISLLVLTALLFLFATILGSIVTGGLLIYSFFDGKEPSEDSY